MANTSLVLAFVAAAFAFLIPALGEAFGFEPPRFLAMSLYLPAVLLGIRSWWKVDSFSRSWVVIVCALIPWIGLLQAEPTESSRGVLIAAMLTMVLPAAALATENRSWWLCARSYVLANVVVVVVVLWFQYVKHVGSVHYSMARFGWLISEDRNRSLTNPNQLGAQLAFSAVLAFIIYLRGQKAGGRPRDAAPRPAAFSLAWCIVLSLACIFTASRGAFVAWFAGMTVLLLWGTKNVAPHKQRDLLALGIAGVSLAVLLMAVRPDAPWNRLVQRLAGAQNQNLSTLGGRTEIWKNAFEMWWSSPLYRLLGTGTGRADEILGQQTERADTDQYGNLIRSSHSALVDWGLSFGVVGMLAGLSLLATVVHQATQLDHRDGAVSRRAILVCVLLFSMTGVTYRHPDWFATGTLLLAMLCEVRTGAHRKRARPRTKWLRFSSWGQPGRARAIHSAGRSGARRVRTTQRVSSPEDAPGFPPVAENHVDQTRAQHMAGNTEVPS